MLFTSEALGLAPLSSGIGKSQASRSELLGISDFTGRALAAMQPRKQRVVASDSDEEPAPLSKKRAPAEKGKKRVVQSDDDESDAPTEYSDEDEQAAAVAAKKRQMDGAAAHKSKGKGKGRAVAASSDEELDEAEEGQGNAKAKGALSADVRRSTRRRVELTICC